MKNMYAGTTLGAFWLFINPLIYASVLYIVLGAILELPSDGRISYGAELLAGLCPWIFASNYLLSAPYLIKQYGYLLKRTNVSLYSIPVARCLTELVVHLGLLLVVVLIYSKEASLSWMTLQILYFTVSLVIFLLSLGLSICALGVFFPDLAKFNASAIQILFWITPIIWSLEKIPNAYRWMASMNPMYYIIDGYRCALRGQEICIRDWGDTFYFWGVLVVVGFLGYQAFTKLKFYFSEVV